jgi:hypothetical protein
MSGMMFGFQFFLYVFGLGGADGVVLLLEALVLLPTGFEVDPED